MNLDRDTYQVAIVGGGPVGMFLAGCLHQSGISCVVLEKRVKSITHSRSIGIHPVSLELFEHIGLADSFISAGIKVKKGLAFCNEKHIGTLSFQSCPPPYRYILTLPQHKTEQLLETHLNDLNSALLERNAIVIGVNERNDAVNLRVEQNGMQQQIMARYVVGCDGSNSFIRKAASIPFKGKQYKDTYIMGDFSDNTSFDSAAAIFICSDGLVESFPLAQNMRRWVVKTNRYLSTVKRSDIETRIAHRIGRDLSETENKMLSSFGVEKKRAVTMARRRIVLAGDAAHVVSPIGGQGMNLGWLDAYDLSQRFHQIFYDNRNPEKVLQAYSKQRLKKARKAIRRAEFNMRLGRKTNTLFFRKMVLKTLLTKPFTPVMARVFTMRGLR